MATEWRRQVAYNSLSPHKGPKFGYFRAISAWIGERKNLTKKSLRGPSATIILVSELRVAPGGQLEGCAIRGGRGVIRQNKMARGPC